MNNETFEVLTAVYLTILKLIHPFMPFITEEIFGKLSGNTRLLITSKWPFESAQGEPHEV